MPQQSLTEFVDAMEKAGLLVRITEEKRVDQLPKVMEDNPLKAVLVEKVTDWAKCNQLFPIHSWKWTGVELGYALNLSAGYAPKPDPNHEALPSFVFWLDVPSSDQPPDGAIALPEDVGDAVRQLLDHFQLTPTPGKYPVLVPPGMQLLKTLSPPAVYDWETYRVDEIA